MEGKDKRGKPAKKVSIRSSGAPSGKKYEVGYGSPPQKGQFRKGTSGNPKGRPKKPSTPKDAFRRVFGAPVKMTVNSRTLYITGAEAAFWKLRNQMMEGNLRALRSFMDFGREFGIFSESSALNPQLQALADALNAGPVPTDQEDKLAR